MNTPLQNALEMLSHATAPNRQPTIRDGAMREVLRAFGENQYYTDPEEVRDRVLFHLLTAMTEARVDAANAVALARSTKPWVSGPLEFKGNGRD